MNRDESLPLYESYFQKAYLKACNEGKSCLGFAIHEFESFADTQFFLRQHEWNFPMDGWCFLGMSAMADPLCDRITETVETLESGSITHTLAAQL